MMKLTLDLPDDVALNLLRQLEDRFQRRPIEVDTELKDRIALPSLRPNAIEIPGTGTNVTRARNILAYASPNRHGEPFPGRTWYVNIEEMLSQTEREFRRQQKNCGNASMALINKALAERGLRFGMTKKDFADYRAGTFKI